MPRRPQGHQQSPTTVIKYVGETKHITTSRMDTKGRKVVETQIFQLTPREMKYLGIVPPPAATAPADLSPQEDEESLEEHSLMGYTIGSFSDVLPPPTVAPAPTGPTTPSATSSLDMEERESEIQSTRDLVKKFISDIWNSGNIDMIPEVCHKSLRFNGNSGMDRVGHEGCSEMVTTVRDALSDYHCEIHSMVVENNKAFCRLKFMGKHTGNLLGYLPTGKMISWMGVSEFTCRNGKILSVWEMGDQKSLENQLRSDP